MNVRDLLSALKQANRQEITKRAKAMFLVAKQPVREDSMYFLPLAQWRYEMQPDNSDRPDLQETLTFFAFPSACPTPRHARK